jgi:phenylalanyl-tRNA synthetase beta chain
VIKSILSSLEIKVNNVTETGMGLTIPFYRTDVQREVDVIEEILRVYGYNNIEFSTKVNASTAKMSAFDDHKVQNSIGNLLASQGFYEIMTNSLSSEKYLELLPVNGEAVSMLNPLSTDLSTLRTSMLFTGLETLSYNINRRKSNLKLFEFGKTYSRNEDLFEEQKHLAVYITGNREIDSWNSLERASDFFYLKSVVENTLTRLGVQFNKTSQASKDLFSEGLTYAYKKRELVSFGIVKKTLISKFDIKQEVLFADFNWDHILTLIPKGEIQFKEIPKYPEVNRDFALLIPEEHQFESLRTAAFNSERKFLKEVSLFDVYTGDNLPKGKKSYGLSFTLLDQESTLTDKQIDKIMSKLQECFEKDFDAQLR